MPPKAQPSKPSKKTELKKKEKVIEDKTFGLKNKKGAKQQKFIQQVEKNIKAGGPAPKKEEKKKPGDELLDINAIFKPVTQTQKIEKGADPKSVLCAFFKQGQCTKGDKCKFSHDLTIERKAEKRSLYDDVREADTMDQWDDEKLKEVIEKKHGEAERGMPKTDIICKFFLDAVEKSKYGWFWECPNGADCHYRHALPPGFILKKDKQKEAKVEISLEDLIEKERAALGASAITRVTLSSFVAWKKRKLEQKQQEMLQNEEKKRADFKAGRQVGLSGREMFTFNPSMALESEDYEEGDAAWDGVREESGSEDEEVQYRELDYATWDYTEDDTPSDKLADLKLNEVPIDENLFLDDDDELDDSIDD